LRIAKLEVHGQILLMALASDISARIHAENELLDSFRKLEEKELSKTRFLAAAGHDLRQPIAAANLFVDTLKHTSPTSLQSDLIEKLDQSMQVFSNQLERLLDISKLDAGVIKPVLGSYDLHGLLIWLEQTFSRQAHDKQLRFRMAFPDNRKITVKTDIGLLQSVLMNLVSNAIKYTSQGGILVSMRPRRDSVLLQVWDTGIGIAEENLHKIFDEFYQVANPQRNRESGLGLGLSIGQRAMSLLGSHITCRSRLGRGSVFSLTLPISEDSGGIDVMPTAKATNTHVWEDRFKDKYVILLEDDALVAHALSALMTSVGAKVLHFQNAEHALHHEDILEGDYFIADHSLEGDLSGLEFLRALQQRRPEKLRAVIITGETSSSFISLASDAPWPVLHKPVTFEMIALHLRA
jgi:two-component sensor histidine kinase/CheY-like chemotaxis protein